MRSARLITVTLIAVLAIALLAACGGDDATPTPEATPTRAPISTPVPTSTPSTEPTQASTPRPTPTPTVASTPTPRPATTPSPTPTPEPVVLNVDAFLLQCAQESLAFARPFAAMDDLTQLGPGDDLRWGQLAQLFNEVVASYQQMTPPEELEAYHAAWIGSAEALRDFAEARPSEGSFLGDIIGLMFQGLMERSFEIALDPSKSDEEKQELLEEMAQEVFGGFFGPDFVAAGEAHDAAREALPPETLALLEQSDCYFGVSPVTAMESEIGLGPDPSFEDDHADERENATIIAVGEPVEGMVDYESDFDFFQFRAQEDTVYRIGVELGIEAGWTVALYDTAGQQHDLAQSAPIFWEAPASDNFYVEFNAWTGEVSPYILTVSLATDDHGNSLATPTRIEVGDSVEGTMDYNTDLDYFLFPAEEGQSYTITVEQGTLPQEPPLTLYSIDRLLQTYGTSPIEWEAPSSGDYYLEAAAFGDTGTYTLSVTSSN